jgi:hypothetical protein
MLTIEGPLAEHLHDEGFTQLLHRIRNEFLEMPGLRLTSAQAARLWALDRQTSQLLLDGLTMTGFLSKNRGGAYVRGSAA